MSKKGLNRLVNGDASALPRAPLQFLLWEMGFSAAKIVPPRPYTPPNTIENSRGLRSFRARRRFFDSLGREGKLLRHSHLYQFLMKSFRFPGSKLQGNDFCSGKSDFLPQNRPLFTVRANGYDWKLERASTLSNSPRFSTVRAALPHAFAGSAAVFAFLSE